MTPDQIKEVLEENIGIEYSKFVYSVLTKLCNTEHDLGNRDINIFSWIVSQFPPVAFNLMCAFSTKGSLCLDILT